MALNYQMFFFLASPKMLLLLDVPGYSKLGLMLKFFLPLIFFITLGQYALSNIKLLGSGIDWDFGCFYQAGTQAIAGGNPYAVCGDLFLRNPPPTLLLYSLFPLFSPSVSQAIFFILSFTSFLIGSYYLFKIIGDFNYPKFFKLHRWQVYLIYLTLTLVFFPFRYTLGSGHINSLLFLFLILTFYFMKRNEYFKSAVNLALGISLSVTPMIFLAVFILQKRIKLVIWTIVNLIFLNLITLLAFGDKVFSYYRNNSSTYFDFSVSAYYNQSLVGFLARALNEPDLIRNVLIVVLSLFLVLLGYFIIKNYHYKTLKDFIFYNISILYILIFSPYSWQYHFIISIIALVITFYCFYQLKLAKIFYFILSVSYGLIAVNIKNPQAFEKLGILGLTINSHVLIGALILLVLNFYLLKRIKTPDAEKPN